MGRLLCCLSLPGVTVALHHKFHAQSHLHCPAAGKRGTSTLLPFAARCYCCSSSRVLRSQPPPSAENSPAACIPTEQLAVQAQHHDECRGGCPKGGPTVGSHVTLIPCWSPEPTESETPKGDQRHCTAAEQVPGPSGEGRAGDLVAPTACREATRTRRDLLKGRSRELGWAFPASKSVSCRNVSANPTWAQLNSLCPYLLDSSWFFEEKGSRHS